MKIYTKTGDRGKTSLFSGERVSKADPRVEAYGDVDELNSVLGALVASLAETDPDLRRTVETIQDDLFRIGGWLATTAGSPAFEEIPGLERGATQRLAAEIDRLQASLTPLKGFLIPGGHPSACWAHIARTVCRRAERHVVAMLAATGPEPYPEHLGRLVAYLNRLSDYLFVLARACNRLHGIPDKHWEP